VQVATTCKHCGKGFVSKHKTAIYCSNPCQQAYQSDKIVKKWLAGKVSGLRGSQFQLSKAVRRYILKENGCKCSACGWGKKNPITKKVPLQVHHIDGDATNTVLKNLQVLCPNCHSLTPNFGKLNPLGRELRRRLTKGKK